MMPENGGYMVAGYVAAALIVGAYVVSLIVRARAISRRGDAIDSAPRR
jgi:hypothetical protein